MYAHEHKTIFQLIETSFYGKKSEAAKNKHSTEVKIVLNLTEQL